MDWPRRVQSRDLKLSLVHFLDWLRKIAQPKNVNLINEQASLLIIPDVY